MMDSAAYSRRDALKTLGHAGLAVTLWSAANACLAGARPPAVDVTGSDIAGLEPFDRVMQGFMRDRSIPGGSLAVTKNQRLVLARGYTLAGQEWAVQPDALFRIASVSKPLTATAVLRLVQEGKTALSTALGDILAGYAAPREDGDPRRAEITLRHLLQHQGGWDRDRTFDPMFRDLEIAKTLGESLPVGKHDIMAYMATQPLQYPPGQTYVYSNYGYCLLGRVIEAVTGRTYEEYIRRSLLTPLGVTRPVLARTLPEHRLRHEVDYHSRETGKTVFDASGRSVPSPYGAWSIENMDAHGGWLASAVDLVRFAASFDDPSTSPILGPDATEQMFGLPENLSAKGYSAGDFYYACGWAVRDWGAGRRNTWHNGSLPGTHALMVRRWRGDLNWCVLFNQRDDASGLDYGEIDPLLHQAADSVDNWPAHDLFEEYL